MAPDVEKEKPLLRKFILENAHSSWQEWIEEIMRIYELLAEAARGKHGEGFFYEDLLFESGMLPEGTEREDPEYRPTMDDLGEILGHISRFEVSRGRPMLSVLVVRKDTYLPGDGFYNLAYKLGLIAKPAKDLSHEEKKQFRDDQLKKIREIWRN